MPNQSKNVTDKAELQLKYYMIDFHNHVLPNVDDGSRSLDMSLKMLKYAAEQGITDVVNTVHYQHPKVETEDISFKRIRKEIQLLQSEVNKNQIPIKLHLGSEVFYLPNLIEIKNDPLTTFNHCNYMLIEFQVHQLPETQKKQLFDLKMSGVTPIIAHPERYKFVQDDISIVSDWLQAGCVIQVDAGSPLGYLGRSCQVISERIIKNGWCQVLGSDSHDNQRRNFCLKKSLELIKTWIGDAAYSMVLDNPRAIISGKQIKIDFEYESEIIPNLWDKIKQRIGIN